MASTTKRVNILCVGILGMLILAIGLLAILTNPGKAPPHPFDSFKKDHEACHDAWEGKSRDGFDHLWILASTDLNAWWPPNGVRAEAELILDTNDQQIIKGLLDVTSADWRSDEEQTRTLREGRIYHALLFNTSKKTYAHLRFAHRTLLENGKTEFSVVTDFNGATPVKLAPRFGDFEKHRLLK